MFNYVTGDILASTADCLVNTVNCEGYMGKGIAYQFKKKFPENNRSYVVACHNKQLRIGTIHTFVEDGKIIVNLPTKNVWREKSKLNYIHEGLRCLVDFINKNNIHSCAIPPLGCGNGGLKWAEVKPIIISYLSPLQNNVDFQIYEPGVFKKSNSVKEPIKPTLSHIILMNIKLQLIRKNRLELQKSAYFFNLISHDDFFKFKKYKYGPYSHTIDIISRQIKESQDYYKMDTERYIKYCEQQLLSESIEKRLAKYSPFVEKATNFVNCFASSYEVELASTICYLTYESPMEIDDIIKSVHEWSKRKKAIFSSNDIKSMIDYLLEKNFLSQNLIGQYEISI